MSTLPSDGAPTAGARRSVLALLIRGFMSLWALGAAAVGFSFIRRPPRERLTGHTVSGGSFSSLAVGEARFVRHGSDPLFVVRMSPTEVVALSAVCTHMRCILEGDPTSGSFICPCHAGAFDRNGNVLGGPPTRPLKRYPAEVRGDEIVVRAERR